MKEERILRKADGTFVLLAPATVGIDSAYPFVKRVHAFTNNGFPKGKPDLSTERSIWTMFRSEYAAHV